MNPVWWLQQVPEGHTCTLLLQLASRTFQHLLCRKWTERNCMEVTNSGNIWSFGQQKSGRAKKAWSTSAKETSWKQRGRKRDKRRAGRGNGVLLWLQAVWAFSLNSWPKTANSSVHGIRSTKRRPIAPPHPTQWLTC